MKNTSVRQLRKQMIAGDRGLMLADLRIRSKFSGGQLTFPELIDFYGIRGFGCIAITDRINRQDGLIGLAMAGLGRTLTPALFPIYRGILLSEMERAWERYRMVVIPGVEIETCSLIGMRKTQILGLGVSRFFEPKDNILEMSNQIRAQGGLVIAAQPKRAHPETGLLWGQRQELGHAIDAWEAGSGTRMHSEARSSGLPIIATSALRRPQQINSWKTILHCEPRAEAILEAIRRQQLEFKFYREVVTGSHIPHPPTFDSGIELLDHGSLL